MAARREGRVVERQWQSGRGYALRFWAYGERQYLTLGLESEGWTPKRADEELQNVLADVRRGIWIPPQTKKRRRDGAGTEEAGEAPLFGPFAGELVASREGQVSENTHDYEEWGLSHLLPYFADWPLPEIDAEAVDAYREFKVKESAARRRAIERRKPLRDGRGQVLRPLAPSSINKTIDILQSIFAVALEYKKVTENAAVGRRRRLEVEQRRPVHLDTAAQIEALLDAAAELDRDPRYHCTEREAILATLLLAGPRAHELGFMLERDIDLANGRIDVGRSKTQAGLREITMLALLRDILAPHKARPSSAGPNGFAFPTATGGRRDKGNLRCRVLAAVFTRADRLLEERGQVPLPKGLTAHKLRHSFASILIACGEDPASVMAQLGHTDPKFTLKVYTHRMRRDPAERARLKALVMEGRRASPKPPRTPARLGTAAYEPAILRALAQRGGSAPRRTVLSALAGELGERLAEPDREILPCGQPRWKSQADIARRHLARRGLLQAGSRPGVWELSEAGARELARRERSTGAREEAVAR
jgi:integrase